MGKLPKTSKNLSVVIDRHYGTYSTNQQLTGKVRISVQKSEGLEVSQISVNLICKSRVRIKRSDQSNRNASDVKHSQKLFDKELRLLNQPELLGRGEQEIPFEFVLPDLPPTSSYFRSKDTCGNISHLIWVTVFGSRKKGSKPIMEGVENFTFVPSSQIPSYSNPQELTFLVDTGTKRGGKFVQTLDKTANNIAAFQKSAPIPILGGGVRSVGNLLKTAAAVGRIGNDGKSTPMLYGSLRLPSQVLRQDIPTDFHLELKFVENADIVFIRSVSINAQVVQILKVDYHTHDSVIDTIPLFHRAVAQSGGQLQISGALNFGTNMLPTFKTPVYSHLHKLEVKIEVSPVPGYQGSLPEEIIELIPVTFSSFIIENPSHEPSTYPSASSVHYGSEKNGVAESHIPSTGAQSFPSSSNGGFTRDDGYEKSSYIPSSYREDSKDVPPPSYDEKY